jgi:hypothetical protein
MIQYAFLGVIIIGAGFAIKNAMKPNIVQLSPPGAVIFNPAPSTGSATFLGSITGTPGQYWNVSNATNTVPSNFVNAMSGLPFSNMSSK